MASVEKVRQIQIEHPIFFESPRCKEVKIKVSWVDSKYIQITSRARSNSTFFPDNDAKKKSISLLVLEIFAKIWLWRETLSLHLKTCVTVQLNISNYMLISVDLNFLFCYFFARTYCRTRLIMPEIFILALIWVWIWSSLSPSTLFLSFTLSISPSLLHNISLCMFTRARKAIHIHTNTRKTKRIHTHTHTHEHEHRPTHIKVPVSFSCKQSLESPKRTSVSLYKGCSRSP